MKNLLLVALLCMGFLVWPASMTYAGFDLGPYLDETKDVTGYARSFTGVNPTLATTGVCKGVLAKWSYKDRWIADIFSPCAVLGFATEGDAKGTALIGNQVLNIMGMRFSVYADPIQGGKLKDSIYWNVQISLTGMAGQLSK